MKTDHHALDNAQLVIVKWNDAWVKEDSVTVADARSRHKPTVITTIGWLLIDDEVGVQIANEHYDDLYRGCTFIMRCMVISVKPYKLTVPRKKKEKPSEKVVGHDSAGA